MDSGSDFFLNRAIELSAKSLNEGQGGPFGAVVVINNKIIAEGWNEVTSTCDPTAHAEMQAIRKACTSSKAFHLVGATIYSSCEPCPMCLAAIYWAKISKVVFANTRKQAEAIGFGDAYIYEQISTPHYKRSVVCEHQPAPKASAIFDEWSLQSGKILY